MSTDDKAPSTTPPRRAPPPPPNPFNPVALVILAILIVGGWLLTVQFTKMSKIQDCVMSGRKNCIPIDESPVGR